jgi:hypothetical protein
MGDEQGDARNVLSVLLLVSLPEPWGCGLVAALAARAALEPI